MADVKMSTLYRMSTDTAYLRAPARRAATPESENSDAVLRSIRATLAQRGTSLRAWAYDWARANNRPGPATYESLKATLKRRLGRGLTPQGAVGTQILEALRADLGPRVVPYPRDDPRAQATAPERRQDTAGRSDTTSAPSAPPSAPVCACVGLSLALLLAAQLRRWHRQDQALDDFWQTLDD